ncbi:hypothetical protein HF675_04950 [Serratia sp. JUb9]|uniref:hypothetical protein n=1 Tax=Serratia sp. JUb9 TaxID=2724469 RepID=UPI00164E3750|nr:hypothetical protein [Serratia sp. JUb9]QNK33408.1 hypothetical protein HF675_04950 [Serratia sp. JUb9]
MSSNFNSLFKSNSGIADSLNQHYRKGQQSIIRKPDQGTRRAVRSSASAFSYQEQQTLHDLGSRMRGANTNQHALYQRQLEQLIGDREITGADARLIALYAKTGSADGKTGTSTAGEWSQVLDAVRDAE